MSRAAFLINGTPSTDANGDRAYYADAGETLEVTLETNPSEEAIVTFSVYSPDDPTSPLASKSVREMGDPLLWSENDLYRYTLTSVNGTAHIVMPGALYLPDPGPGAFIIRCKAVFADRTEVFERGVVIAGTPGLWREGVPAEQTQFLKWGWAELLRGEANGGITPGADGQIYTTAGGVAVWSRAITRNGVGENYVLGLELENTTAANGGSDQWSPAMLFEGRYWDGASVVGGTLVQQRDDRFVFAATADGGATESVLASFSSEIISLTASSVSLANTAGTLAFFTEIVDFNVLLFEPNNSSGVVIGLFPETSGPAKAIGLLGGDAPAGQTAGTVYTQPGPGDSAANGQNEMRDAAGDPRIWLDSDASIHIDIPASGYFEILEGGDSMFYLYRPSATLRKFQIRGGGGAAADLEFDQQARGGAGDGCGYIFSCSDGDTNGVGGSYVVTLGAGTGGEGGGEHGEFSVFHANGGGIFLDEDALLTLGTTGLVIADENLDPYLTFTPSSRAFGVPLLPDNTSEDLSFVHATPSASSPGGGYNFTCAPAFSSGIGGGFGVTLGLGAGGGNIGTFLVTDGTTDYFVAGGEGEVIVQCQAGEEVTIGNGDLSDYLEFGDGGVRHFGSLGLFGAAAVTQPADQVAFTDNTTGTANRTLAALPDPADSPGTADALRDDLVANVWPVLRNWAASLADGYNDVRVNVLQATGLMA